jgi:hypothetical protein
MSVYEIRGDSLSCRGASDQLFVKMINYSVDLQLPVAEDCNQPAWPLGNIA